MQDRGERVAKAVAALRTSRRVNVIGTSGTGKTTFCRSLAAVLGAPCHEMDALFWRPQWQAADEAEFLAGLRQAVAGDEWVLDGNYTRTQAIKWATVQCVVWLDYSFGRTMFQAIRRAIRRSASGDEIWAGTGNRETFRKSFFSRDSVLLWTLKTYRRNGAKYRELLEETADRGRGFGVVRIASPAEADEVIRQLAG